MCEERCDLPPARQQHVGHVAEWNDGENKEDYAYSPGGRGQHQGQHGQSSCDVPRSLETEPGASVSIRRRRLKAKASYDSFRTGKVETSDHNDPNGDEYGDS